MQDATPTDLRRKILGSIEEALGKFQPLMRLIREDGPIVIEGRFQLDSSKGFIDAYEVRVELTERFPNQEPTVFEIGGRIPVSNDRHVNPGGNCCITVWESWLAEDVDHSFGGFINGPMREYFLNQFFFENTGKWRFGERAHGTPGLVEAYAEALDVQPNQEMVLRYLQSLAGKPKGHLPCPCGSGKILRKCHQTELHALFVRPGQKLAARMLSRLEKYLSLPNPNSKGRY